MCENVANITITYYYYYPTEGHTPIMGKGIIHIDYVKMSTFTL